jgi:hypothetical protein
LINESPLERAAVLCDLTNLLVGNSSVSAEVKVDPAASRSQLNVSPQACGVGVELTISPDEVLMSLIRDVTVGFFDCNSPTFLRQLEFPSLIGNDGCDVSTVFQLIIDKLSNLERCCSPCQGTEYKMLTGISGVGSLTLPVVPPFTTISTIWFAITQEQAQKEANFSNPPRWKYGSFTWVADDGTDSKPQFINYNAHRFRPPQAPPKAVAISWHLEPGVVADVYGTAIGDWTGGVLFP